VHHVALLIFIVLELWFVCALARAVISWFPLHYGSPMQRINSFLVRVTEPVIAPVRRLLPPMNVGGVGLDLAFLIVVLVIELIAVQVHNYALS
jgi:YggT family protein